MRPIPLLLVIALAVAGCSWSADDAAPAEPSRASSTTEAPASTITAAEATTTAAPPSSTDAPLDPDGGVVGPVVYQRDGIEGAEDAGLFGTLRLDGNCLVNEVLEPGIAATPLLFPFGTTWDDADQAVRFPDGVTVRVGERFETGGGNHATDALGYWVGAPAAVEVLQGCGPSAFVIRHPVISHALDPAGGVDRAFGAPVRLIYAAECDGCLAEEALGRFELDLVDGCLVSTDGAVLVWPFGTRWNPVFARVELADGATIEVGDRFEAGGGFHADLTGFADSADARAAVAECSSDGAFIIQSPPTLGWGDS